MNIFHALSISNTKLNLGLFGEELREIVSILVQWSLYTLSLKMFKSRCPTLSFGKVCNLHVTAVVDLSFAEALIQAFYLLEVVAEVVEHQNQTHGSL